MKYITVLLIQIFVTVGGKAQDLYFPPAFSDVWDTIHPISLDWCIDKIEDFDEFLEETNTNACIILKDGKIVHEAYFNDFDTDSPWYWASAGKTVTAAMVGIIQEEGALSIDDPTSAYLGQGWTSCSTADEDEITIRHQLTMTTGLDYMIEDIYCTEPACLTCLNEPGEEWFYHNGPYTLLSEVIESALDQNYTAATSSRLTNKLGFLGFWSYVGSNRLFFSSARGMARFGLLMLNNGDWDGEVILKDKDYVNDMINTSQDINESYGYLWWLNGKESFRLPGSTLTFSGELIPNAPEDLYAAIGANGQILMVVPSQNLIIVRMGNSPDSALVPTAYVQTLWDEYEKLLCPVSTKEENSFSFTLLTNLSENYIEITSEFEVDQVQVYDMDGKMMISSRVKLMDISSLAPGKYIVVARKGMEIGVQKFIKI